MTNYKRGADFERKVKKDLEDIFGAVVIRSAGSRTPCDLVAMWPDKTILIQVQIYPYFIPLKVIALSVIATYLGHSALLVWREGKKIVFKEVK